MQCVKKEKAHEGEAWIQQPVHGLRYAGKIREYSRKHRDALAQYDDGPYEVPRHAQPGGCQDNENGA
jgi:hypothetical protein